MSTGWRAALRLLFVVCVVMTTLPLAASAQDATPTAIDQQVADPPTETAQETVIPAPTEDAQSSEAVEPTATDEPTTDVPTTEPTTPATAETQTSAPVETPATTSTIAPAKMSPSLVEPAAVVNLFVEKIYCQDDARAGMTEFTLDTPPDFMGVAASTCHAEPPFVERPPLTVTLDNVDTGDSHRITLTGGGDWVEDMVPGTYTATESADGMDPVTSAPFEVLEAGKRLRIINYYAEEPRPEPDFEGWGWLEGMLLFCPAPDRDGDVEFIIESEGQARIAAVAECAVADNAGGLFTLHPVDPNTMEIDLASGMPLDGGFGGQFYASEIPSGYYALGYLSPETSAPALSEPFAVYDGSGAYIEVNVFSTPVEAGDIEVWKDFCVDPARAGEVAFQVNAPSGPELPPMEIQAATATECRFSNAGDGELVFTLTNVDTGRTWTETLVGDDWVTFSGIPTGTYTLTELYNGVETTSQPFAHVGGLGYSSIYVRNFIAQRDWEPGEGHEFAEVTVYGYICVDLSRDGGAEYFHYGPQGQSAPDLTLSAAAQGSSTAECRETTEEDGLQFSLMPADGEGEPIPFFCDGYGTYLLDTEALPAGDYIITEATTGVSTGALRLTGNHYLDFLKYEPLPEASVTVNISSADPAIANELPADATWTVTQNGVELFTDTFATEHLQLPASIAVTNPVAYGTYDVTVSAGPTFEAYTGSFTVDEPEEIVDIVLQPVRGEPTPSPTPVVGSVDVIVTVTTVDGGEIPTGTEVCLAGEAYDECWALDATAGRLIAAATPSSTTVMFADVPLGTYELSVPANAPYLAFAETIQVPASSPYEVTIVLQRQGDTPSPTATPGTPTPATATPTSTAVITLPSTGGAFDGRRARLEPAATVDPVTDSPATERPRERLLPGPFAWRRGAAARRRRLRRRHRPVSPTRPMSIACSGRRCTDCCR
jgi:hypothetical protein